MKNIHIIPTDKPPIKGDLLLRHLWKGKPNECISWWRYNDTSTYGSFVVYTTLNGSFMDSPSSFKVQHIYITSDEEDINENDYIITKDGRLVQVSYLLSKDLEGASKIILTTDQDLIKDGVQLIDDESLEWFVNNPSCEYIQTTELSLFNGDTGESGHYKYEIIIPQEEPKQDPLEEAAENYYDIIAKKSNVYGRDEYIAYSQGVQDGVKYQAEISYSKEEVKRLAFDFYYDMSRQMGVAENLISENATNIDVWFEQFNK